MQEKYGAQKTGLGWCGSDGDRWKCQRALRGQVTGGTEQQGRERSSSRRSGQTVEGRNVELIRDFGE